ncbi:MAG: ROK family protein [Streptosporangiales bacterium]|nr:ROK family protein [Streptosporangiales bacterium]
MLSGSEDRRTTIGSPGEVLALISAGAATTRADLARETGLARSTVSHRVDALMARGLIREVEDGESTGGRPPRQLRLRTEDNVVVGVDLGATHCRMAIMHIGGELLAVREDPLDIAIGPEETLTHVDRRMHEMLGETDIPVRAVRAIGMGVPGPVEFASGRPVSPPIMPGWNEYPIPEFFTASYDVDVLVDNDVNVMALGEHRNCFPNARYLLYVKIGTGIGCGIIADRQLHRGAQGCAGDIGHIRVSGHDEAGCRCGNSACLEAVAGGAALARRLSQLGLDAGSGREVVELVHAGDPQALRLVREAGRLVGEVLAGLVNFFNPEVIVVGGVLATVHEHVLAGIREAIYRRSAPLATHGLEILPSRTGRDAAVLGAGILAIEHFLAPAHVDRVLAATGT